MLTSRSNTGRQSLRIAVLAIIAALVLVPTIARARQQVERHDATRLSIKHSWLGVAPQPKAVVSPVIVAVRPVPATGEAHPHPAITHVVSVVCVTPRAVIDAPDPLRGPPAVSPL
jgi:hypothetical protein